MAETCSRLSLIDKDMIRLDLHSFYRQALHLLD